MLAVTSVTIRAKSDRYARPAGRPLEALLRYGGHSESCLALAYLRVQFWNVSRQVSTQEDVMALM